MPGGCWGRRSREETCRPQEPQVHAVPGTLPAWGPRQPVGWGASSARGWLPTATSWVPSQGGHWEPCQGFDPRTVCPPSTSPCRCGGARVWRGEPRAGQKNLPLRIHSPPTPRPQVTRSRAEEMPPQHCALWGDPQQPLGFSLLLPLEEGCR